VWWTFPSEVLPEMLEVSQQAKSREEVLELLESKIKTFELYNLPYYPIEFTKDTEIKEEY